MPPSDNQLSKQKSQNDISIGVLAFVSLASCTFKQLCINFYYHYKEFWILNNYIHLLIYFLVQFIIGQHLPLRTKPWRLLLSISKLNAVQNQFKNVKQFLVIYSSFIVVYNFCKFDKISVTHIQIFCNQSVCK